MNTNNIIIADAGHKAKAERVEYDSDNEIEKATISINTLLKPYNNEILVFDFSHFWINKNEDKYIVRIVTRGDPEYDEVLNSAKEDKGSYTIYSKPQKLLCNLNPNYSYQGEVTLTSKETKEEAPLPKKTGYKYFEPKEWFDFLSNKPFGGCALLSSLDAAGNQSNVYLTLRNKLAIPNKIIDYEKIENDEIEENLKNTIQEIFKIIDSLLINELAYNAVKYYKEMEFEKERLQEKENKLISLNHNFNRIKLEAPLYFAKMDTDNLLKNISKDSPYFDILLNIKNEIQDAEKRVNLIKLFLKGILLDDSEQTYSRYSVIELLKLIIDTDPPTDLKVELKFEHTIDFIPSDISSMIHVLYHLWINTKRKYEPSATKFWIHTFNSDGKLAISFENFGKLPDNCLAFLKDKTSTPPKINGGLDIIKKFIKTKNWYLEIPENLVKTHITLFLWEVKYE